MNCSKTREIIFVAKNKQNKNKNKSAGMPTMSLDIVKACTRCTGSESLLVRFVSIIRILQAMHCLPYTVLVGDIYSTRIYLWDENELSVDCV